MHYEVFKLLDNCRMHARCIVFEGTRRTSVHIHNTQKALCGVQSCR
jgi:hypothetical protein